MIRIIEKRQIIAEKIEDANLRQLQLLQKQMDENPELAYTLTTPLEKLPKYKYLFGDNNFIQQVVTLLEVIERTIEKSDKFSGHFIKTSSDLFVGFIAFSYVKEKGEECVNDIKLFSFGVSPKDDDNVLRHDIPKLMDEYLDKYSKMVWMAHKDNRANLAYKKFIDNPKREGERISVGTSWRYICKRKK